MFVGREYELNLIKSHIERNQAELIVIFGRRRVGKTVLIQQSITNLKNVLFFEGIEGEESSYQIRRFLEDLARQTGRPKYDCSKWSEVFSALGEVIKDGSWTIVFDEFPWMASGRSRIVSELKVAWDKWKRNDKLNLFLCGSVASFMIKHIVHSRALHNRKTLEILLRPLSPIESGKFINDRSNQEKANMYMAFGGIPKYLEQINPRKSIDKNINDLCFTRSGFFVNEYETLFKEQFKSIKNYERLAAALSEGHFSMSDLSRKCKIERGGGINSFLHNLEMAQFVKSYSPVNFENGTKTRTKKYKLVDPFLMFYFKYIRHNLNLIEKNTSENLFKAITQNSINQYRGFAFERLCEDSINQLLKLLDINLGDIVEMGPYFQQKTRVTVGVQIDYVINRRDGVVTLIEYKYSKNLIGNNVIEEAKIKQNKIRTLTTKSIEHVLVTSSGVTKSLINQNFFTKILNLDDLLRG